MTRRIFPQVSISGLWAFLSEWLDDHPTLFLLGVLAGAIGGILLLSVLLAGCPHRYSNNFLKITDYDLNSVKWERTPKGIRVKGDWRETHLRIDQLTDELEKCFRERGLAKSIRRNEFAVFIPPDWYPSKCGTGELLVPSRVDYRLCEQKKDPEGNPIKIPVECRDATRPTKECPCPCNVRATIQPGPRYPVIVTAPNLKLYKTELARVVLYARTNTPWADKEVAPCLK